jgi:hypothetical protein
MASPIELSTNSGLDRVRVERLGMSLRRPMIRELIRKLIKWIDRLYNFIINE